jgi:chaperonin GroEL (HSP60 family)
VRVQGDGTTTSVLFIGELLKYAERYIAEVRDGSGGSWTPRSM